jgi:tryptophan synthase alpha chain
MGGDPNPTTSVEVAEAVLNGGADILEIGIPFSDPIADGKTIQAAGVRALASGTRPRDVLNIAAEINKAHDVPIVLMTYFNPVFSQGVDQFLHACRKAGVDGIIVPDLPFGESHGFAKAAKAKGVDSILLAAPTTTEERMNEIVANTSGFLYLVSLLGVTGPREELTPNTVGLVRFARRFTFGRVPLAVGFGISKPEHVRAVLRSGADAVIVGSAIVNRVADFEANNETSLKNVEGYVRSMKSATRGIGQRPGLLEAERAGS